MEVFCAILGLKSLGGLSGMNQKGIINLIFSFGIITILGLFAVLILQLFTGERSLASDADSKNGVVSAWRDEKPAPLDLTCGQVDDGVYHCRVDE